MKELKLDIEELEERIAPQAPQAAFGLMTAEAGPVDGPIFLVVGLV